MVDINTVYGSFLKAADLGGRNAPVTILGFTEEEMPDGAVKPALTLNGTRKKLVLNKTNANMIASLYGTETDHWAGKQIVLYSTQVPFGDKMVDAIRVQAPAAPAPAPPAQQVVPAPQPQVLPTEPAPAAAAPPPGDSDFLDF